MAETTKMIEFKTTAMETITIPIIGMSQLVQHRMSDEVRRRLIETAGNGKKPQPKGQPRDLEEEYNAARHLTPDGLSCHPASAFRSAMIRAAKLEGYKMTDMRAIIFVVANCTSIDGTPGIIIDGKCEQRIDIIPGNGGKGCATPVSRPCFREWRAEVGVYYPTNMITPESIVNLCARAGTTVGVGCGRPMSSNSDGQGWGTWRIDTGKKGRKS